MGRYLSDEVLEGFDSYKYSSKDTSPFSNYVMHPFWNAFVKWLPLWLPANAMTFFGFLLLPLNFIVLTYYDQDFTRPLSIPSWVWFMCAFNNHASHTLDGADGKQARRTGTSSALGELFDHGLDAWSTSFFAIAVFDVFGQGYWGAPPFRLLFILIALQCTFVFSHWEKYNTGVLFLPWGYDPAIVGMTLCYTVTWLYGVPLWHNHVTIMGQQYTIANILETFLYVANFAISCPVCIFNVIQAYRDGSGRMLSLHESLRPLFPVAVMFPMILTWAYFSRTHILETHPRCFYMLSAILFANITSRLIVNQMSHTRADAFNNYLVPLILLTPICCLYNIGVYEGYALYGYTVLILLAHIRYGFNVVHEMAEHLNIYVFSVEKPPSKTH